MKSWELGSNSCVKKNLISIDITYIKSYIYITYRLKRFTASSKFIVNDQRQRTRIKPKLFLETLAELHPVLEQILPDWIWPIMFRTYNPLNPFWLLGSIRCIHLTRFHYLGQSCLVHPTRPPNLFSCFGPIMFSGSNPSTWGKTCLFVFCRDLYLLETSWWLKMARK